MVGEGEEGGGERERDLARVVASLVATISSRLGITPQVDHLHSLPLTSSITSSPPHPKHHLFTHRVV